MTNEPINITVNCQIARKISYPNVLSSSVPNFLTVSYITIPIASLNIDSPKTMAYRLTSASSSLKIAKTDTGSVAEISDPKAKLSFNVNSGD